MASLLSSGDPTLATISYKATSSDLSFDNSYYFASSNTSSNFNVYYWSGSAWSSKYTQTKSGNFGHQIACTWDGDRFVVGSPHENKVYVYHSPGGSGSQKWTHNASGVVTSPTVYTISCPDSSTTGRRFGWSVSIAKDLGNHIIIGAPGDFTQSDSDGQKRGKVYIYEFNGSTWSKTFEKTDSSAYTDVSNAGSSVSISEPEIQLIESSATSGQAFYQVNNASPQFGFYVDISGYAEYIAIGVPGTPIGLLNSTNLDGYSGSDSINRTGGGSDYFENTAQLGCIVCYSTSNTNKSWASNTSLYGKPVRGQTEMSWTSGLSGDNSSNSVIWDFTALGTTCKLSLDGTRLIGGSPRYSFPGKQQSPNFGRLDAWNYGTTDSDWVLGKGRVVGNRPGNRIGMNIAVDYTGQRIVALLMIQPAVYNSGGNTGNGGIMVFDWNGNGFYEVVPEVQTNLGSSVDHAYGTVAISKGDVVAASAWDYGSTGRITFYFYKLTGGFDGNSLVGGYCAADTFLVGPNDGSTQNTFKKQIKFGGTFFDNTYENTTLENRIYHFNQDGNDANQQGYSELLISKKTSADAPDMIRFKSNEFRIDTYVNQNNSNQFNTSADGEYDHHPALTMNIAGNFKLNAEFETSVENTQCETKALLDVEGDIFGRRRVNAGYLHGQSFLGRKWPWQILYDTRSAHTKNGNDLYSNTFNEFNSSASYKQGRLDSKGVGNSTITHHESEGAITLSGTGVRVHNSDGTVVKSITGNGISGSLWFKLINEHSTYGGVTLVSYGNPHATNHTGFRLQVTNDNIRLNFGTGKIQPSPAYSLTKDKWYHVYYSFKPQQITTLSNTELWINGVFLSSISGTNLANASYYNSNHYIGSPLGDSAINVYIGMVAHYNSHYNQMFHAVQDNYIGQFASPTEMYNWGPPGQKLAVGGDAFIENRLSIGGTHSPEHPLDVTGDINFTGTLRQNNSNLICLGSSSSAGAPLQVLASTSNTSPTNNGIFLSQTGISSTNHAIMAMKVNGANSGDPFVSWDTDVTGWSMGIDNDDSDILKIANNKDSLSTDTHMEFSSAGTDFLKPILANGTVGTSGQVLTSGGSGGTVSWTTVSGGGGGSSLSGSNTFEWGTGVSGKESNAGKIGYSTFSGAGYNYALDIVGAGTSSSNRNVRIYDNIGIGTSSPEAYLHVKREGSSGESNVYIQSYSDAAGDRAALFLGTPHVTGGTAQPKCAIIADTVGWSRANLHFCLETSQNNGSAYRASTSNSRMMIDGISGNIGMGTTTPGAFLDINGTSQVNTFTNAARNYFRGGSDSNASNFTGQSGTFSGFSIRASSAIGTNTYFVAHTGTWQASDSRIKTNINDVTDASALEKLRLLEPKTYKYIDTKERGDTTVYGFIAQEVSNVFPEAVMDSVNSVPNIYELSNVSDSNVITFTNFNTSDLLTSNVTSTIQVKSVYDKIERLTLDTVIDSKSIRVKEDLTNIIGSVDDTGNVVSGNQVFVMGQEVDNFNIVKKEYIFTIATAALQEVDRQLQAEKTKVSTLETQVADLLARVTALENA